MGKRHLDFVAGLLTGAVLFGGSVAYAAGIAAQYNPQTVNLDGRGVQLEAYNINGYNYVKLRDIGQAVGFNVYWADNMVHIDSRAPYTGVAPTQAASIAETIRVSSFKGNTLKVGELGALVVYPQDPGHTAVSSDPAVVSVKNVQGSWIAEAKSPGTATITIKAPDGRSGSVTITVVPAAAATIDLTANMEVRQEMVRLINQVRRENGVPELAVSDALMNAAQAFSAKRYTQHNTKEECELVSFYGYPHGFNNNLTVFSNTAPAGIARQAVNNWINSPGHFQAMIDPACDCIGIGVTIDGGRAYCQMFAGDPNSHMPYEQH